MSKRSFTSTASYETSIKYEVAEAPKVEETEVQTFKLEESPKARPGSFAALISQ
jgi:hypothetical protein